MTVFMRFLASCWSPAIRAKAVSSVTGQAPKCDGKIDRHAYLQADYGVFYAGKFLREASPGRNINYLELWAGYKF